VVGGPESRVAHASIGAAQHEPPAFFGVQNSDQDPFEGVRIEVGFLDHTHVEVSTILMVKLCKVIRR
jgi:hypothetical protein